MADDWMPIKLNLRDDPAVVFIREALRAPHERASISAENSEAKITATAALLYIDADYVVGKLCSVWSWVNQHLEKGNARGVTKKWIDDHARCPGLAEAMVGAHWLVVKPDGISIPKFDRWNCRNAKNRLKTAERQRKFKQRKGNDASVTKSLPEKRREEKNNTNTPRAPLSGGFHTRKKRLSKTEQSKAVIAEVMHQ